MEKIIGLDPMVEDVDEENIGGRASGFGILDKYEFGFDEELNIGRIGENRAHLGDGFYIPTDCDNSG